MHHVRSRARVSPMRGSSPARPRDTYDVVVVGSGVGGGTIAQSLAGAGARVLVIERGSYIPRHEDNWSPHAVWRDRRYRAQETWLDGDGCEFEPYTHYCVGGNSKFWGSVLYRLRREDFEVLKHRDGVSPAWPITYEVLEPYYDRAERLFCVRGAAGEDPTDPPRGPFPYPAVPHQGRMVTVVDRMRDLGLHPSALPLGLLRLGEPNGCRLCNTCNAYPCKIHAKSDVEVCALAPSISSSGVTLWTNTLVRKLHTNGSGDRVVAAEIVREGRTSRIDAPLFVVSCGAVNSAALLLRSACAAHPEGLGNSSGMLGRNYMAHFSTMLGGFMPPRHETSFQKTVGVNDYYLKGPDRDYPLGNIQSQGRSNSVIAKAAGPPVSRWIPDWAFQSWFSRSVEWLAMTEDLPDPDNRVTVTADGRIQVRWEPRNLVAHRELLAVARGLLRQIGCLQVVQASLGSSNTTHQCGTAAFGTDAKTSVLDPWCRSHDVANLFVVDASFFPSSAAVNPGLTIAAQALRTADHMIETYSSGGYRT